MSRIALPPLISPQLFRHFAVVTVVLTICIGLIADNESRAAIEDEFAEREAKNAALKAEHDKVGERTIRLRRPERVKWHAANDSGPDLPVDAGSYGGSAGDTSDGGSDYSGYGPPPSYEMPPVQPDPWSNQPFSGRDGAPGTPPLLQKKKPPFKPSPEDIQRTIAEARARSGGDDSDDY